MHYLAYYNQQIRAQLALQPSDFRAVLYGQNISRGSCLSGFSRNLPEQDPRFRVLNTPNAENTLVGLGFGMMLNGVSSLFFMNQLDFLLLGLDQIVNTWNMLRTQSPQAAFSILPVVVDIGYQGPQSSFNNLSDFCNTAGITGYTPVTQAEIDTVLGQKMLAPGFRIITASQRLFRSDVITQTPDWQNPAGDIFRYGTGTQNLIIARNFAAPAAFELQSEWGGPATTSILNLIATQSEHAPELEQALAQAKRIVIMDDSKRHASTLEQVLQMLPLPEANRWQVLQRQPEPDWYFPNPEHFAVNATLLEHPA